MIFFAYCFYLFQYVINAFTVYNVIIILPMNLFDSHWFYERYYIIIIIILLLLLLLIIIIIKILHFRALDYLFALVALVRLTFFLRCTSTKVRCTQIFI